MTNTIRDEVLACLFAFVFGPTSPPLILPSPSNANTKSRLDELRLTPAT